MGGGYIKVYTYVLGLRDFGYVIVRLFRELGLRLITSSSRE